MLEAFGPLFPGRGRVARRGVVRASLASLALLGAGLLATGCGSSDGGEEGAVPVVATTTQVADLVREVGGEAVDVHQLLQPNSDPHDYEPRPSDVQAVAGADLIYASGDGLDGWIEDVADDAGSDAEIVDLGAVAPIRLPGEDEEHAEEEHAEEEHAEEEHAEEEHHHDSEYDPHWWHDPRNAAAAVAEIERTLTRADPSGRKRFAANAAAYERRLRALDAGIAACVDSLPAGRRKLVTDHDAFNYFAERYGLEVVGAVIPSQTTQAQPSAKDLSDLAATIEAEEVEAIFPESSVSSKVARAIAAQTGADARHTLYGDALGPEGSPGATYIGMMEANADSVMRGLSGGRRGCEIGA